MFWNFIRWGGTLIVMLLVLATTLFANHSEDAALPLQPLDGQQQPNKNFNL